MEASLAWQKTETVGKHSGRGPEDEVLGNGSQKSCFKSFLKGEKYRKRMEQNTKVVDISERRGYGSLFLWMPYSQEEIKSEGRALRFDFWSSCDQVYLLFIAVFGRVKFDRR